MSNHLKSIMLNYIYEQKCKRRWGLFFKFFWLIVFFAFLFICFTKYYRHNNVINKHHVALVTLDGIIGSNAYANSDQINKSLKSAFKNEKAKGVILRINSTGGSPVESDNIYQQIRYLIDKYPEVQLYAVCTDVCTSGGYYVASAAKEIYANKMTMTGSIGVRSDGFGFTELIDKVGIERRLYTAGKDKGFLDPFQPQNSSQVSDMENMLMKAHETFISAVKIGRGSRINSKYEDKIFSGAPFLGIQAKEYGLIDGFGSVESILQDKFKNLPLLNYTQPLKFMEKINTNLSNELSCKVGQLSELKLK